MHRITLSQRLRYELYTTEVENLADQRLVGGQKELADALEAMPGGKGSTTLSLNTAGAEALIAALDNCQDISNDGGYQALGRAAGKKRDEIEAMLAKTQTNPGPSGSLLGLGTLTSIEILDPRTKRVQNKRLSGLWLGWMPGKRAFAICRVVRAAPGASIDKRVANAHRRFHAAPSKAAMVADVPSPIGALRQVGLLKALTYEVPRQVRSPGKNRYQWHHAFGDTGHQGGDRYPERVMPALMRDTKGNLFIKRRPGNIFTVDTWLRG